MKQLFFVENWSLFVLQTSRYFFCGFVSFICFYDNLSGESSDWKGWTDGDSCCYSYTTPTQRVCSVLCSAAVPGDGGFLTGNVKEDSFRTFQIICNTQYDSAFIMVREHCNIRHNQAKLELRTTELFSLCVNETHFVLFSVSQTHAGVAGGSITNPVDMEAFKRQQAMAQAGRAMLTQGKGGGLFSFVFFWFFIPLFVFYLSVCCS